MSTPEIRLIMDMADFFEVSVDVLLGYVRQNENVDKRLERIQTCILQKDFDGALAEAEKALKKYPNNFNVVYMSAAVHTLKGMENKEEKVIERSTELFHQAIALLSQNTEQSISEVTIRNQIAENYMLLNQTEKGLKVLEENNVCEINSSLIGFTYAYVLKQPQKAWPFLRGSFVDQIGNLVRTISGIAFMYERQNKREAIDTIAWLIHMTEALKTSPEKRAFVDKYIAVFLAQKAVCHAKFGQPDLAEQEIRKAYKLAKEYDASPIFTMEGIRFLEKETELIAHDDMGKTAMESIENNILKGEDKAQKFVSALWEEMKNEETIHTTVL